MDWPVASVLMGTLGTVAVAVIKWLPARPQSIWHDALIAIAEIRSRLDGLERSHELTRSEVRSDIKELERTLRNWMGDN